MTDNNRDYKQELNDLFACYVHGKNTLSRARNWYDEIEIKPEFADRRDLPQTFMELQDEASRIIAHSKYQLDTYPNIIQLISAEQMRDAYAKNGMPISYDHWSFGKNLIQMDQAYSKGQMGLAYEIVINTNPSIAYCMESNTPAMQMLVTAHASYGHNSFFKGNHLFRQFTQADSIIDDLKALKHSVEVCEKKFGEEETSHLIDACHALQYHSVNRYTRPERRTPEEEKALRDKIREEDRLAYDDFMARATGDFNKAAEHANDNDKSTVIKFDEENLLGFIAAYAPHMEEEKRQVLRNFCVKTQYFYPQMQTQVMNEGWASFWHHTILYDLYEEDIVSEGMMMELLSSHSSVVFQPEFDSPYFSGSMNPYALGIAIYQDIKRICLEPTDEDKKWFPHFAGNPDWLSVMKGAMEDYKDESFIAQFLSPKVIRDFGLFAYHDDDKDSKIEISAIHDDRGYREVRRVLASNYDLGTKMPSMRVAGYDFRGDRSLHIEHQMYNRKPLNDEAEEVMKHIHYLWKHPVVLNTVDQDTNTVVKTQTVGALPATWSNHGPASRRNGP